MTDSINWCDLKKNAKHIGEVSTSRVDGSPTGAEILNSTNEVTGQVRDTLAGKFKKMDDTFNSISSSQFIVTNFGNWSTVAGQQIVVGDELKGYEYPDDSGDVYAVKGSVTLPITRPATPEGDDRFYLASSVNIEKMRSEAASQLWFVYSGEWSSGIVIPANAMANKLAYWYNEQFYSVGTDTGFTSTSFDADLSAGKFISEITATERYVSSTLNPLIKYENNNTYTSMANVFSSTYDNYKQGFMIIGDSITEGVGAVKSTNSYKNVLMRCFNNLTKNNYGAYYLNNNMNNAVSDAAQGVYTDGTIVASGAVASRLKLTNGQYVSVTNKQVQYVDIMYDGAISSGTLTWYLNGAQIGTKAIDNTSGIKNTFLSVKIPHITSKSDVVKIVVAGAVEIIGVQALRPAGYGPLFSVSCKSGWAYQNFNNQSVVDELTAITGANSTLAQTYLLMLGTNNLYNPSYQISPSALISEIDALIAKIRIIQPNSQFVASIPPKANESVWPITAGYKYEDYVDTYLSWSDANNVKLIRNDLVDYANTGLYADGVHPSDAGHIQMARTIADTIGVPFNTSDKISDVVKAQGQITLESGITGNSNAIINGDCVVIDSVLTIDPSTPIVGALKTVTIGTLPSNFSSSVYDKFFIAATDIGSVRVRVSSNNVELQEVETLPAWVAVNLSYIL